MHIQHSANLSIWKLLIKNLVQFLLIIICSNWLIFFIQLVKLLSASTTKIEPEIIEVQPKRYRKPPPPPKAAVADEEDDEIPDTEGSAPCTRPGCVAVVRAIIELQAKNYLEKLEIEDEYHRLLEELVHAENQVASAENKLEKLNEIGNQLEVKLGQLMQNVETLEKKKETLQNERSDINNKVFFFPFSSCISEVCKD